LRFRQKAGFAWAAVGLLALLCGALAVLQYRWTGEISAAEADQMHRELGNRLALFRGGFDDAIEAAARQSGGSALFTRAEVVDRGFGRAHEPPGGNSIEIPQPGGRVLVAEVNPDYLRKTVFPDLLNRFLSGAAGLEYDAAVFDRRDRAKVIYESAPGVADSVRAAPDAVEGLLNDEPRGRGPGPPRGFNPGRFGGGPPGRWVLMVRHRAGSLDAVVAQVRRRNIGVSGGMLLLIIATAGLLVQLARRHEQLAALQMNFVTGVSHELRTPLTVIRTAAFNLQGKPGRSPEQVERYGKLIGDESEKLTALVEQVLLFARADSAPALRERRTVSVEALIEGGLRASCVAGEEGGRVIERRIEADLPPLLVDEPSLTQALRNLLDNAVRYGNGREWIGVSAVTHEKSVEIRVADHGPGIPEDEQPHIFEAFFRGRRAIDHQIHGTGLGLNLTRRIIEANGGAIRVESAPLQMTVFIVTLPASVA